MMSPQRPGTDGPAGSGRSPPDAAPGLDAMDIERHLADASLKRAFVAPMFDLIAPRYDEFTQRFSFGMDRRWKRRLLTEAAASLPPGSCIADLATGTGDLAYGLAAIRPDTRVIALDLSPRMLALAAARRATSTRSSVGLSAGDLDALPFATGSIDGVLAGYALRNAPDWRRALAEVSRVIRVGGHVLTLDFYRPELGPWRSAFLWWLSVSGRFVGARWHNSPMAYGYIARSIDHFASWQAFSAALEATGFRVIGVRRYLGGGIALHHAVRR